MRVASGVAKSPHQDQTGNEGFIMIVLSSLVTGGGKLHRPIHNFVETSQVVDLQFRITPEIMVVGVLFGVFMGAIGGLFPARNAAKKEILVALREV